MTVTFLLWLIIGALLIGGELLTGTFYLLIFGLAAWFGAAATYLGYGLDLQLLVAGVASIVGLVLVVRYGKSWRAKLKNDDSELDIGNEVRIESVLDGKRLKVVYRGSSWDAVIENMDAPAPKVGSFAVIRAVRGNTLVVQQL